MGQRSNVGSLGRVYVMIVDTFEEKKESGHYRQYGFYSIPSTVKVNSSKICQFALILLDLLNKTYFCQISLQLCQISFKLCQSPIFINVFHRFYGNAIVPTFIDIVAFLSDPGPIIVYPCH